MRTLRSNHSQWGTVKASEMIIAAQSLQHSQCSTVIAAQSLQYSQCSSVLIPQLLRSSLHCCCHPPTLPQLLQLLALLLQPLPLRATCLCHAPPLATGVNTSSLPPAPASCTAPQASASPPRALPPQALPSQLPPTCSSFLRCSSSLSLSTSRCAPIAAISRALRAESSRFLAA